MSKNSLRQVDKDLILISALAMSKMGGKIEDIIPNFDGDKLADYAEKQDICKSNEVTIAAITSIANESYARLKKKFSKG